MDEVNLIVIGWYEKTKCSIVLWQSNSSSGRGIGTGSVQRLRSTNSLQPNANYLRPPSLVSTATLENFTSIISTPPRINTEAYISQLAQVKSAAFVTLQQRLLKKVANVSPMNSPLPSPITCEVAKPPVASAIDAVELAILKLNDEFESGDEEDKPLAPMVRRSSETKSMSEPELPARFGLSESVTPRATFEITSRSRSRRGSELKVKLTFQGDEFVLLSGLAVTL